MLRVATIGDRDADVVIMLTCMQHENRNSLAHSAGRSDLPLIAFWNGQTIAHIQAAWRTICANLNFVYIGVVTLSGRTRIPPQADSVGGCHRWHERKAMSPNEHGMA
jgi:hypothetical protein